MREKTEGLTLSQALTSGRAFKRPLEFNWREPSQGTVAVSAEEIEAKDWMIKPELKRFTIYVSPNGQKVSFDANSPYDWDRYQVIEESK